MKRELGIARCGLACCLCSENDNCNGCNSGECPDKEWCKNRKCSISKNIEHCYNCNEDCRKGLLSKIKPYAFTKFAKRYGEEYLLDCLERNERNGIVYHREGIVGDYDDFDDVEALIDFIKYGNAQLRFANRNDVEQIADIKVRGWQTAYKGIIDTDYLNSMAIENQIDNYSNHYDLSNVIVAETDNNIVGFCRFCFDENSAYDCEIREIYVKPTLKRTGIGSMLFDYTKKLLQKEGKKKLVVGVFTDNINARKFYEKMGGIVSDSKSMIIDDITYDITIYSWDIDKKE